jgi:hypothetical protein
VTRRARLLLPAAALVIACTAAAQPAAADGSDPNPANVVPVSGTSPLPTGCGLPAGNGYTLNPNTEVQPMLAVDPGNASHLVGIYQQDRWNRYGSNGAVTVVSDDAGLSWHRSAALPAFSTCNGGTAANGGAYDVTTDHWITVTPSGAAIAASFSLSRDGTTTAMLVSRSGDGGEHWAAPVTLRRDDNPEFFNDRPSITADPYHPGVVYAVWDRSDNQSTDTTENWTQPVYLAKSTDDGRTWTSKKVVDTPTNSGTIGNVLQPLADGTLLLATHFETDTAAYTQVMRSTDGGSTWSAPTLDAAAPFTVGVKIPDPDGTTDAVRNATLPLLAVQPGTKVVNAVWQSQSADGTFHVAYARSTDDGVTWSSPVRIDKTPTGSAAVPAVAVSPGGTLAVTYYDFRNNTSDPATLPTDAWAVTCAASCTTPASWHEQHIEGPFDARTVPATSSGRMLGDYTGLVSTGSFFVSLYGAATGDSTNPVDIHGATFYAVTR